MAVQVDGGEISDAYPVVRESIGQRSDIYRATELDQEARIAYEMGVSAHDGIMKQMVESEKVITQPIVAAGKAAIEFLRLWDNARRYYGL